MHLARHVWAILPLVRADLLMLVTGLTLLVGTLCCTVLTSAPWDAAPLSSVNMTARLLTAVLKPRLPQPQLPGWSSVVRFYSSFSGVALRIYPL